MMSCLQPKRFANPLSSVLGLVFGVRQFGSLISSQSSAARPGFDGPAELPRIFLPTSTADTPAPGKSHLVKAGDNLQEALDRASCGDTVRLEAGATFTGILRLPQKRCDDLHWIIIRTSAPDSDLPPEGTRVTPCYAGIASLPGRPAFPCPAPHSVLARITFAGKGASGPIFFAPGANHYRLLGLEITRTRSESRSANLASPEEHAAADHLVFDRVWIHGTAQDETTRGLYLSGTTYVPVVDSYFSDFHCVALTGACVNAHDIVAAAPAMSDGPYKIVNNFL